MSTLCQTCRWPRKSICNASNLALEARRFENRLRVEIALPDELADTPVPRLILQPLVENAVKYALGGSHAVVTIRIAAEVDGSQLVLIVDDDGSEGNGGTPGVRHRYHQCPRATSLTVWRRGIPHHRWSRWRRLSRPH